MVLVRCWVIGLPVRCWHDGMPAAVRDWGNQSSSDDHIGVRHFRGVTGGPTLWARAATGRRRFRRGWSLCMVGGSPPRQRPRSCGLAADMRVGR